MHCENLMRTIVIGAGSAKRIGGFAKELPKSLIEINGKSILSRQISLLKKNEILDIVIITGPNSEKFDFPDLTYVHDEKYLEHDILGSLMEARNYIKGDVLITYSDILVDESILHQILENKSDIGIAIDLNWEEVYHGRTEHPKSEAENVLLDKNGKIIQIKKNIQNSSGQIGEFLGIVKLSSLGSKILVKKYENILNNHKGKFHNAPSLIKGYMTDMIQELINSEISVTPIFVSGNWCEIDTTQDLERAEKIFH